MIVDASAVLAVLFNEPDAGRFVAALADHPVRKMSVANYVEAGIRLVHGKASAIPRRQLDTFIRAAGIEIEAVSPDQGRLAIDAYRDFGKGSDSPAQLNLGDCFAYALAKDTGLPLLFKGNDFTHTDIEAA
ncbi:MAG: type II toxin-antitoxin system VapC family toxin [Rhodospirillaceae bacterium]|nr:type II toxin-antitoxin system VapC family toxin [Rhodospirillaceae bacterium]